MTLKYRTDIDGLRALAVMSVVFFHLDFQIIRGGFVGVDIFFVISGFLITGLIKKEVNFTGTLNIKKFYLRRIRRLFPAFFMMLFLTVLFSILIFSPTHLSRIGGAVTSSILSISNIYFWLESDYFDVSTKLKPLLHTWSLAVEEQFYFLWPLLLLFLMKLKKAWIPQIFLIFAGLFSLYLNIVFSDGTVRGLSTHFPNIAEWISDGQATIFFLLPFRIFEFSIGALLVWLIHLKTKLWMYDLLFIIGLGLVFYAIIFFNEKLLFPSFYGLVPTLGTALLIYSGVQSRLSYIFTNKVSVAVGKMSYSLYLVHWPVIVFWIYIEGELDIHAYFYILLITFILASLSYQYIEQPFRKGKLDITKPRWKYGSIVAVLLLGLSGVHMKYSDGWSWRVSKSVVFDEVGNAKDYHIKFYGGAGYIGKYPSGSEKANIILMGDSHAQQYAEGLYKGWIENSNHILYVSRCFSSLYLPNFVNVVKPNYENISVQALKVDLDYILNADNPLVIISESWVQQMKQSDMIDSNGKRKHVKITVEHIIQGILDLKKVIGNSTLVVIGQVPGAQYNLYDVFSRPRPILFSDFDPQEYMVVPSRKSFTDLNKALKEAAIFTGKFTFLDPHDILCKDGRCQNLDSNKHLIYSDAYHLSKYGSLEVIKGFLPQLKVLINEN
jgi:peptidoglycan/LPS O-acetylase OafA/YrhL